MREIVAKFFSAFCIFGIVGFVSVLVDMDSIWKVLGITSPLNFTIVEGRDFHTPLLFILIACVASIIITTFAFRQAKFRRIMGVFPIGVQWLSTPVLEPIPNIYSGVSNYQRVNYKKNGENKL